jgi:hypothetical protein
LQAGKIRLFHVPIERLNESEGDHHFSVPVPKDKIRREQFFRAVDLK